MSPNRSAQRKHWIIALGFSLLYSPIEVSAQVIIRGGRLGDVEVRQKIVEGSVAAYLATGRSCACPYNSARDGSSCGERGAYNRPSGALPVCYPSDVTDEMVEDYRRAGRDKSQ
jgi:hypothetical protein